MSEHPPLIGTLESALYAEDLDAATHFWTQIIGLELITHQPNRHAFFRIGAQVLLVFDPKATMTPNPDAPLCLPAHGTYGPGHFCIGADASAIDAWQNYLENQGVQIEKIIDWPQGGRSIYFRDPAGNSIEIADPAIWK